MLKNKWLPVQRWPLIGVVAALLILGMMTVEPIAQASEAAKVPVRQTKRASAGGLKQEPSHTLAALPQAGKRFLSCLLISFYPMTNAGVRL
jgi:hypothetical protein